MKVTTELLPVLPLRGFVIFPKMIINFDVGRKKSIQALEKAMVDDEKILLTVQKEAHIENPLPQDITSVGTVAKIKQILKLPNGVIRVLVEGLHRAVIEDYESNEEDYFVAKVSYVDEKIEDANQAEAIVRTASAMLEKYADISKHMAPDTLVNIISTEDAGEMADLIGINMPFSIDKKIELLTIVNPLKRLERILVMLEEEARIVKLQKDIQTKVKTKINKNQKDYYLKEQLKAIQDALGEEEGVQGEVKAYQQKLDTIDPPDYVREKIEKELDRMIKIPQTSQEAAVVRNYIEWVLDLPWTTSTKETLSLVKAERILNKDHYGLKKVKERILEHIAVREFAPKSYSPILCLVGPPGVGKTSIAASIAEALNRKYVRISLGGVRDEAEIRGHRKTYVGAMPGRIITALKQSSSNNSLMLLDEIDKMGSDFRGDPTAALLEVLDPEQNKNFRDHFIELQFDISDTLFIATANSLQSIPRPLLDRMEIIHVSSYTEDEKIMIAKNHLLKKQLEKHGLKKGQVRMDKEALKFVINHYTKESGVRNVERKLAEVIRKSAREILTGQKEYVKINKNKVEEFLGLPPYHYDKIMDRADVGIARGLAWTSVGGDTLSVEVNTMKGNGTFQLTGQLGDVMKESAKAAMSYIRSRSTQLGLKETFYKNTDIHIHIPEGAVPKDGPSAGITMATAIISALTNIPVRNNVAMTGEITLRGRVLPIGGLKEKLLAAKRAGITKVIVPIDNEKNVKDLEEEIIQGLDVVYLSTMDQVLEHALTKKIEEVK